MTAPPPLEGIRVVDLTWNLPGPYTTHLLAALGAVVTKVEPPRGDPARAQPNLFEMLNHGKEGVVLDLRTPQGQRALHDLVAGSDVFVEGFRPGVAARLGCGPEDLCERDPRLVYCSISAYGQTGPRATEPGHDLNAQALAGAAWLGRDRRGRPHGLPLPIADLSAAQSAVASICAALYQRERTGRGAVLDIAMTDTVAHWSSLWSQGIDLAGAAASTLPDAVRGLARGLIERLDRERLRALPHYTTFRCSGGGWLAVGIVDEQRFWASLCAELGLSWAASWSLPARAAGARALRPAIAAVFARRSRETWLERLTAAGIPVTPVWTPEQALQDPQIAERLVGPGSRLRAPLAGARFLPPGAPRRPGDALS